MLNLIVRRNRLYPLHPTWIKHIMRWQDLGYVITNYAGSLVYVEGDDGRKVTINQYAFGTKVKHPGAELEDMRWPLGRFEDEIATYVDTILPPVSERARQETEASRELVPFGWKDGSREIAIRLVYHRFKTNRMTFEESVVDVLSSHLSSVCVGVESISVKTVTLFVSDCWEYYRKELGTKHQSQTGETDRIYAALTGQGLKPEQLDLFSWQAS